jgi:hypothetical protein
MVSGYRKYRLVLTFSNTNFCPHGVFYVLYRSENKQRLSLASKRTEHRPNLRKFKNTGARDSAVSQPTTGMSSVRVPMMPLEFFIDIIIPSTWLSYRSDRQPKTNVKPEAAITVFELLMMGGVSPETC